MSDSGQKFIRRNRAPRVHITYEDPSDAEKLIELPFVMGVMADLSGNAPGVENRARYFLASPALDPGRHHHRTERAGILSVRTPAQRRTHLARPPAQPRSAWSRPARSPRVLTPQVLTPCVRGWPARD